VTQRGAEEQKSRVEEWCIGRGGEIEDEGRKGVWGERSSRGRQMRKDGEGMEEGGQKRKKIR